MQLRASLGTAATLGLCQAKQENKPRTAYLLLPGVCQGDCAFCPQARSVHGSGKWLSRITWPLFTVEEIFPLEETNGFEFRRICLQTITEPDWAQRLERTISRLREVPYLQEIPISSSGRPANLLEVGRALAAGLERLAIPLDVANPQLYTALKGGSLPRVYRLLKEAAERYPQQVTTHLIVGLGETEEELAALLLDLAQSQIPVALFAFTPVRSTRLARQKPPSLKGYRRIQVLRYLLAQNLPVKLTYGEQGAITSFGYSHQELEALLSSGAAFQTSGCPDCNRPYYNERPGQIPYNYPRPLTANEVEQAFAELWE